MLRPRGFAANRIARVLSSIRAEPIARCDSLKPSLSRLTSCSEGLSGSAVRYLLEENCGKNAAR